MGLDLRLQNPNDESDSVFIHGNECGSVMRIVKDMNHYCLVATSGKTLSEVKFDILQHIGVMMSQIETYDYVPTSSRHDSRFDVTLQSDLELMAQLVGELNKVDVPDNWTVEWDY
jgi:hypothetical protein